MNFPIANVCESLIATGKVTKDNITDPKTKLYVQRVLALEARGAYQLDMPDRAMVLLDAFLHAS